MDSVPTLPAWARGLRERASALLFSPSQGVGDVNLLHSTPKEVHRARVSPFAPGVSKMAFIAEWSVSTETSCPYR